MDEKILKRVTIFLTVLTLVFLSSISYYPILRENVQTYLDQRNAQKNKEKAERLGMSGLEILEYNTKKTVEKKKPDTFQGQLRLELPFGVKGSDITMESKYQTQTVQISIPFADSDYFYEYPMIGNIDHINGLDYTSSSQRGMIEIQMDGIYIPQMTYDKKYCYITFKKPREYYKKVVVIDAGHGGKDSGAYIKGIYEKDLTLDIVLELKKLFEQANDSSIGVYYTRTDDTFISLPDRANLANLVDADAFLSVHINSTPSGRMNNISGTQIHYNELDTRTQFNSQGFAQSCLDELVASIGSRNRGMTPGNELYVVRSVNAPSALVEVGFMTNQTELNLLKSEDYQKKAAQGLYNGIMKALQEGY